MSDNAGGFEALRSKLQPGQDSRLTLNRQEMILLPRHFFRYILRDVNAVSGSEAFRKIFWKAGHDGAETFCRRFQEVHRCTARQAVEGYLNEMSLRHSAIRARSGPYGSSLAKFSAACRSGSTLRQPDLGGRNVWCDDLRTGKSWHGSI